VIGGLSLPIVADAVWALAEGRGVEDLGAAAAFDPASTLYAARLYLPPLVLFYGLVRAGLWQRHEGWTPARCLFTVLAVLALDQCAAWTVFGFGEFGFPRPEGGVWVLASLVLSVLLGALYEETVRAYVVLRTPDVLGGRIGGLALCVGYFTVTHAYERGDLLVYQFLTSGILYSVAMWRSLDIRAVFLAHVLHNLLSMVGSV
jgi:membrane protease YdiL (CAAX protease family)